MNLKTLFGKDLRNDNDLRDQLAQAVIDKIIERTEKGKDINGEPFEKYSTKYKQSDEFKDFGKTSKVDMTLRGRMLDDVDIISETTNTVKIGFTDELETKKAYRHNSGDKGMTKRQFFGVTEKEVNAIKKEFASELKEKKPEEPKRTIGTLLTELGTLGSIFGEN